MYLYIGCSTLKKYMYFLSQSEMGLKEEMYVSI